MFNPLNDVIIMLESMFKICHPCAKLFNKIRGPSSHISYSIG